MAIGRILESLNPTWPLFQTHCALTIPLCHLLLISPPYQLDFSFLSIGFLLLVNWIFPPYQLDFSSSSIGFLLLILESLNPTWPLFQNHCALTIPLCHLQHCHWLWISPSSEELDNKKQKYFPPQLVRHFNGLQSLLSTLRQARSGFCTNSATNNIFKQIPFYHTATNNISTQISLYNDTSRQTLFHITATNMIHEQYCKKAIW